MPSPINDSRFWTKNVPISGAKIPTQIAASRARCMNPSSNG
jgi:hypothetical protein